MSDFLVQEDGSELRLEDGSGALIILEVPVGPIVIYGGDDAPRKQRKRRRDVFRDVEQTIHQLLHPDPDVAPAPTPVAAAASTIDDKLHELLALAQGSHGLLQRAARLRADVDAAHAAARLLREEDDEETLMWLL